MEVGAAGTREINIAELKQIPLLGHLSEDEMMALLPLLKPIRRRPGDILFRQGHIGASLFFIIEGAVKFTFRHDTGHVDTFEEIGPRHFFGEVAVFGFDGQRTATAEVTKELTACELHRDALRDFLRQRPEAALHLLGGMAERLRRGGRQLQHAPPRNLNKVVEEKLTLRDSAAQRVARFAGSTIFLVLHAVFFVGWVLANGMFAEPYGEKWILFAGWLGKAAFDPFPYHLLGLLIGVEALVFSCFVLMNQSREDREQAQRNDLEYNINVRAEQEVSYLHQRMDGLADGVGKIPASIQALQMRLEQLSRIDALRPQEVKEAEHEPASPGP